ncbi:2-C-methyl-D-erythritol 4-phosphate cytidylyltransferase [Gordonia hirsuta DSM 44140 = NBRC 16056]|uniref:2-C-methyl-D-erythritol 4-phosphate cytidylyltransferase n=2 Tax=Gordonia hirsuta TaxID=53427 RepID=L7L7H5_9ACTN|nr:2-C-methyl-D-erythritol 4-phosphate cytidylyltransferase [Gordonia hirsuta DSM 44140 = NBRC 16056]
MGQRLGAGAPKAFVELDGRSLLARSVSAAQASGVIDDVVVIVPEDLVDPVRRQLPAVTVVAGGRERSDSVRAGLAAAGPADRVLVHDAARALTPPQLFVRVVQALEAGAVAVVPGLPVADTLKRVDDAECVVDTPDRAALRAVQTPQGFTAELLRRAHAEGADATDDAGLVEALGVPVQVVPGEHLAFKITTPFDLQLARFLCGPEHPSYHRTSADPRKEPS